MLWPKTTSTPCRLNAAAMRCATVALERVSEGLGDLAKGVLRRGQGSPTGPTSLRLPYHDRAGRFTSQIPNATSTNPAPSVQLSGSSRMRWLSNTPKHGDRNVNAATFVAA